MSSARVLGAIMRAGARAALSIWLLSTLAFFLLSSLPGDASLAVVSSQVQRVDREALRARWQLDRSLFARYASLLTSLAKSESIASFSQAGSVFTVIGNALPHTVRLAAVALAMQLSAGGSLGLLSATHANRWLDRAISNAAAIAHAAPVVWLALLAVWWHGPAAPTTDSDWRGILLPALVLAIGPAGSLVRVVRGITARALGSRFARTARALGQPPSRMIFVHVVPHLIAPVARLAAASSATAIGGSLIVEIVFGRLGLGTLAHRAVLSRDTPLVVAITLTAGTATVIATQLGELIATIAEPTQETVD